MARRDPRAGRVHVRCSSDDEDTGAAGASGGAAGAGGALGGAAGSGAGAAAGAAGTAGAGGAAGAAGSSAGPPSPAPEFLPTASGACPALESGDVTFSPSGINSRRVKLWLSDAANAASGPLIFFWHGVGGNPVEAEYVLGDTLQDIEAAGGIVAAPYHDPTAGTFPWFMTTGGDRDDLRVADEVVACALEAGIDPRRIHVFGFSAGALMTAQMTYRRSGYVASMVSFSGGILSAPPDQDPGNQFPAALFHGGDTDNVVISFQSATATLATSLADRGSFHFVCNHNSGHTVPANARPTVWQFFEAHPFGADPEPYAAGLPPGFPSYCTL